MVPMMSGSGGAAAWILVLVIIATAAGLLALGFALAQMNAPPIHPPALGPHAPPPSLGEPEATLRMRYARGEIDTDELERRLVTLEATRNPSDPAP
jgi:hypothetical protein